VYPALSVSDALREVARERGASLRLLYLGHSRGVEADLVARAGIPFAGVESGQIRGQSRARVVMNLLRMGRGYTQALGHIGRFRPHVVFLTGGWVTAPVALAARTRRVPVVIYLPDVTPGLAIQQLQRLARRVAVTVPEAATYFPGKAVVTGYPVRPEVVHADRERARARWQVGPEERVLLVFGGSRGARSINRAVVAHLESILRRVRVIHVTGRLDHSWVQEAWARLTPELRARYHVHEYLHEEMADALAAADLVLSRAGASVLGEFPARGLPAILVPYPHAGRHQEANARYLVDRGAAVMVEDAELSERLLPTLEALLGEEGRLDAMRDAARRLYRPDAARHIATILWELGQEG